MAYVKAIAWSFFGPMGIAAVIVAGMSVHTRASLPADRAAMLAASISEAVNCAALLTTLLLPIAIVNAFLSRRERRRRVPPPG